MNLGKKTGPVLDLLRRRGHTVVGDELIVKYPPGSDPYIGTQAADLELEIRAEAEECGHAGKDFTEKLTFLHGLGPQSYLG